MNEKALQTLEFDKILSLLEAEATSAPGRILCKKLRPSADLSEIKKLQDETADAVSRILKKGSFSFAETFDIQSALQRLEIGSSLNGTELLQIARLLENAARAISYGQKEKKEEPEDSLSPLFSALDAVPSLSGEIRRCLLSETEVADDASSNLKAIRKQLLRAADDIHTQLRSLLNGPAHAALQDAVITMRDGRYCVPVKAEFRSSIPGMIHDQSSTGATVFVEPMAVVQINNKIRDLQLQETAEIEAILAALSASAAEHASALQINYHTLSLLDFHFARGRLALSMRAVKPQFPTDHRIALRKARHPLIDSKKVVPIDVSLGDTYDLLIITGPNTGGKTVSLKTVGLLTLMGQAGLHIPCQEHPILSVFSEVYADIGDEQSIEQSLSTFSAHMTHIVGFLEQADADSLALFDELGAGTDPTEGAALAIAILSFLHGRGIRTMATTHYSELKLYALATEGVENASCEFDVDSLRPTYRLLTGIPGKSNAFAISGKLGIPETIIQDARSRLKQQDISFEDVLAQLETNRLSQEEQQQRLNRDREVLEKQSRQLAQQERQFTAQREKLLEEAQSEARTMVQEAKAFADRAIRSLRKAGADPDILADLERQRTSLRERLTQQEQTAFVSASKKQKGKLSAEDLRPGDAVRVISMQISGIVRSLPNAKGEVDVQMGILRSMIALSDLEKIEETPASAKTKTATRTGTIQMAKSYQVHTEINLLGKTVDDAILELDKYLDDAYLAHLEQVRIVHGKGTGALRKGIHAYLKKQKRVKEFQLAAYGEGDAGVTVVTFR